MTETQLAERFETGLAHANREWPGWWRIVDPATLAIGSPTRCVLGQQFWNAMVEAESYVDYPSWGDLIRYVFGDELPDPYETAIQYGFDARSTGMAALEELWREAIERLRATDPRP